MEPQQHSTEEVRPRLPSDGSRMREMIPHEDLVRRTWRRLHLAHGGRPIAAALIIGGAAITLAVQVGAPELGIGAVAAYVTYRMMRYGIDLKQALTETVQLERAATLG